MSDAPEIDAEPIDAEFAELRPQQVRRGAGGLIATAIIAAVLGGVIGGAAAWFLDQRSVTPAGAGPNLAAIEQRLSELEAGQTDLETQTANLAAREMTDSGARSRLDAVDAELSDLSEMITALETPSLDMGAAQPAFDAAPLRARLETLESEFSGIGDRIAALQTRNNAPVAMDDPRSGEALALAQDTAQALDDIAAERAALEARLSALESRDAARDGAADTAFLYAALREAAMGGRSFQLELAALESGSNSRAINALRPLAAEGVMTEAELLNAFPDDVILTVRRNNAGVGERARGALASLGTLRRADESEVEIDPLDMSRDALNAGDLTGAVEALTGLPSAEVEAASDWIAAARSRLLMIEALDALRTDLMEALP